MGIGVGVEGAVASLLVMERVGVGDRVGDGVRGRGEDYGEGSTLA